MTLGQSGQEEFGAKFMLQEHSRIIDAYHDLHVQKNELLKFYLAFVSIPLSVVALFLSLSRFVPVGNPGPNASQGAALSQPVPAPTTGTSQTQNVNQVPGTQASNATQGPPLSRPIPTSNTGIGQAQNVNQVPGSQGPNAIPESVSSQPVATPIAGSGQSQNINQPPSVVDSLQDAATYLTLLLVPIGLAVISTMLSIRTEQYLYVQTVNATRNFFKTECKINKTYFVLPFDPRKIEFGGNEVFGRTFWEAMIVSSPTSLLVGFLGLRILHVWEMAGNLRLFLSGFISVITFIGLSSYVGWTIRRKIRELEDRITKIHKEDDPLPSPTDLTVGKGDRSSSG